MAGKLEIGDTVAYTAKFLRSTGQKTGGAGERRGKLLSFDANFARVRWNDWNDAYKAALADQWGADYAKDAEQNGQTVAIASICRVGPNMHFSET